MTAPNFPSHRPRNRRNRSASPRQKNQPHPRREKCPKPPPKKILSLYNMLLRSVVEPRLGMGTSIDYELSRNGRELLGKAWMGVYPSDKLPESLGQQDPNPKFLIMNVDPQGKTGSHWLGVASQGNMIYLYDSFGRAVKQVAPTLIDFANRHGMKVHNHTFSIHCPEQGQRETNCGQRALAWLIFFHVFGKKDALLLSE